MLGVGDSHPPLATYGLNLFYHPFYPDVTNMRKDTRPSPAENKANTYRHSPKLCQKIVTSLMPCLLSNNAKGTNEVFWCAGSAVKLHVHCA